jgi:regulator of nucleoside diphosphate kinase
MTNGRTIVITKFDAERLREAIREAEREGYRGSRYIDSLKAELERAEIVEPKNVPDNVITMNSKVSLMDLDSGEVMVLTLVFPKDADINRDKISVLAPIGTAVLGYHVGDTIEWEVPDGTRRLEVRKIIYQPEASGDFDL